MPDIETHRMTDEVLKAYDEMMVECTVKVEKLAPLAISIWTMVLEELDGRGKVRLISGSYDDLGNALIQRM
jgi:hypothetical protein